MKLLGVGLGLYIVGVGIGVILGVITFQIVTNITGGMVPAPTGVNKTVLDFVPTFLALAIMMLPVSAIYVTSQMGV